LASYFRKLRPICLQIYFSLQLDREISASVGSRPLSVSLSTTPGKIFDSCDVSSCSDKPDCAARVLMMSEPNPPFESAQPSLYAAQQLTCFFVQRTKLIEILTYF